MTVRNNPTRAEPCSKLYLSLKGYVVHAHAHAHTHTQTPTHALIHLLRKSVSQKLSNNVRLSPWTIKRLFEGVENDENLSKNVIKSEKVIEIKKYADGKSKIPNFAINICNFP